eukprot:CAMPEP_0170066592 /NCGR_PEP_ID=MMETSP0019_2-20121128/6234_1 /TAXON_ID=98059 /ORGANISM="Dinobryon sp., Strain UTEXLB2267" /LENGTH=251 /DNA_ID=CAMNT_0010273725 /DNA_START=386 /DNA_END=1138 /DNA_ORIENTATION=+
MLAYWSSSNSTPSSETLLISSVEGGVIDMDEISGLTTGVLRERAVELMLPVMNKGRTLEEKRKFIIEGLNLCAAAGLTSVQTNDETSISVYKQLQQEELLPLRVFLTPNYDDITVLEENGGLLCNSSSENVIIPPLRPLGFQQSTSSLTPLDMSSQDSRLIIERLKIYSDGSLGAETAAMRVMKPLEEQGNQKGVLIHSRSKLLTMIRNASAWNYRLEIHAIGDAAAEQVLDALLEHVQTSVPCDRRMEVW